MKARKKSHDHEKKLPDDCGRRRRRRGLLQPRRLAQNTITWRMQTYAGAALAAHVIKPAVDMFNVIAGDRMQIELFFADQLVPTGELFRAMQRGTIDARAVR